MLDKTTNIYLWTVIERMLFSPSGNKDIAKWFRQYHKFALKLWGKPEDYQKGKDYAFKLDDKFQISFKTPFDLPKFSLEITQNTTKQSLHYDNTYFSELDLIRVFNSGIERAELNRIKQITPNRTNLEYLIHNMITHPALHFHYEDISHYIRLSFNTQNPFLFLYHFAFQFCDYKKDFRDSESKKHEFKRLVDLVEKNIGAQNVIPSGVLFGL
ncbi:MAG: hypothetical protein IMY72_02025 [Bacteroidetes bacterium]|nr:hypothetical protein [Bacteroidota bacterium]